MSINFIKCQICKNSSRIILTGCELLCSLTNRREISFLKGTMVKLGWSLIEERDVALGGFD